MLPLTGFLVVVTLALITTFFVTSADSATFVLGMQSTNGNLNPPNYVKVTWGLFLSATAIILLRSGGLSAMQTSIIVSAFPLTFALILMAFGVVKEFNKELPSKNEKPVEHKK